MIMFCNLQFEDDRKYIYIFIGGFSLSLLMLLISLVIFFRFRLVTLTNTVVPAKSDSDVMFCLQCYQGLIIDISLVY